MSDDEDPQLPPVEGIGALLAALVLVAALVTMQLVWQPEAYLALRLIGAAACVGYVWTWTAALRMSLVPHLLWSGYKSTALFCLGAPATALEDISSGKTGFSFYRNDRGWLHPKQVSTKHNNYMLLRVVDALDTVLTVALARRRQMDDAEAVGARAVVSQWLPVLGALCIEKQWENPEDRQKWTWVRGWVVRCLGVPVFEALLSSGLVPVHSLSTPAQIPKDVFDALEAAASVEQKQQCRIASQSGPGIIGVKFHSKQNLAFCCAMGGRADLLRSLAKHGAEVCELVPATALTDTSTPNTHHQLAGRAPCSVELAAKIHDTHRVAILGDALTKSTAHGMQAAVEGGLFALAGRMMCENARKAREAEAAAE
jgi:hypothetical protein